MASVSRDAGPEPQPPEPQRFHGAGAGAVWTFLAVLESEPEPGYIPRAGRAVKNLRFGSGAAGAGAFFPELEPEPT